MVIGQVLSMNWQPDQQQQHSSQWTPLSGALLLSAVHQQLPVAQKHKNHQSQNWASNHPSQVLLLNWQPNQQHSSLLSSEWVYTNNSRSACLNNWIGKLFWPSASAVRGKFFCSRRLNRFEERTNHTFSETHNFFCLQYPVLVDTSAHKDCSIGTGLP